MKIFNSVLTDKIFTHLDTAEGVLRLLRSLGYDLHSLPARNNVFRDIPVTAWSTPEQDNLPCLLLEMTPVTRDTLYPVVLELVKKKPRHLVLATADYRYLFIAAVQQTHTPSPVSDTGQTRVLPSTVIRRLDTKHLTGHDRLFLEELTRTCESGHTQFEKILYAFNRIDQSTSPGISTGHPAWTLESGDSLKDTYHYLRRLLQPFRDIAYSGSQSEKCSRLILPVLNTLGYAPVPVNAAYITSGSSTAFLLTEQHSETSGTPPVACCLYADPLFNPFFLGSNIGHISRLLAAHVHPGGIIEPSGIRKLIVTDGRIWAAYHLHRPDKDPEPVDLYRLLKLDYGRSLFSLETFSLFLDHFSCDSTSFSGRPATSVRYNRGIQTAAGLRAEELINSVVDLFKPHMGDTKNLADTARLFLYEIFHILYCELTHLAAPLDENRWNIPELYRIVFFADSHSPGKNAEWITLHLAAAHDLDAARNSASGIFSEPVPELQDTINRLDARCLLDCVKLAGHIWIEYFGDDLHLFRDMTEDFCRFLGSIFTPGSVTGLPSKKESDLHTDLSHRFEYEAQTYSRVSDRVTSTLKHPAQDDFEWFLQYHVIDPDPGTGLRLIQALKWMETFPGTRFSRETGPCLAAYLQDMRSRLMQDSHKQRLFLDHRILTDTKLFRLLCVQQCLYGLTGQDMSRTVPATLFLSTGLNNIRFPHIGHHFQQNVEYTIVRLSRWYKGLLPGHLPALTGALAGFVTAGRWIAATDRDFHTCGPDFEFVRRQYHMLQSRIHSMFQAAVPDGKTPVELVFPWLFYSRLSGETGADQSGNGFDMVLV